MDRLVLNASERTILGKKVKKLRHEGKIPGHVFGDKIQTEHVSVNLKEFLTVYNKVGETGLIDLRIADDKIRPVLIREVQHEPVKEGLLHIDFYQVNLTKKVTVPVPIIVTGGEDIESVKMGEAVILQTLNEVEVEALPTDLIEKIEVDIAALKNIDDAITVGNLDYDRSKLAILADSEEIVVKLAPAVTEEMKKLMQEQEAEQAAAAEAVGGTEGEVSVTTEGVEVAEGEKKEEEAIEENQKEEVERETNG